MIIKRDIPGTFRAAVEYEATADFPLIFLTITHAELSEPIRVVSDPEIFMLDGFQHIGFEFQIELLNDNDAPPRAQLTIQTVDRRVSTILLRVADPPMIEIQVIDSGQFDLSVLPRTEILSAVRLYRARKLYLSDVSGDKLSVTGTLRSWDYTQDTWPALRATEARFPGLFW